MTPSPINPIALHVDDTMPTRHFSKVFHRDHPGREIATFTDPETHRADAEAFIALSRAADPANWPPARLFAPMLGGMVSQGYETCGTMATLRANGVEGDQP